MPRPVTFAICGCGDRGLDSYAPYQTYRPEEMKITAGADIRPERLALLRERYGVPPEMCFSSDVELLAQPRLADVMLISTLDRLHVPALAALDKGYHILLEKPISPDLDQCRALQEKARETGRTVVVCHVLRYTRFYAALEDLLRRGAEILILGCTELPLAFQALGTDLPCIDATEELAKAAIRFCGRALRAG